MIRGASIVCISSIDWKDNRQNPQEFSAAFSEAGNRVLYVENTGARSVRWRDAARLRSRLVNWWRARGGAKPDSGVDVLSPLLLPFPYSRIAQAINARLLLRFIRRWLQKSGDAPLIVVTFLPTPLVRSVIDSLDPAVVVYYCIDRLAESSPGARRIADSEAKLVAEADLVFVTSNNLYESAARMTSNIEVLASGVSFAAYERARNARTQPHPAFEGLGRPVIGFSGTIRDSTDTSLLADAVTLAPDLNFILVGPQMTNVKSLARLRNVRLTGAVPYEAVMDYVVRFDVGLLPYVLNPFTAGIMPLKLKEYLAGGLPIVATPLPEVLAFAERYPGIITFASDGRGFAAAIRTALAENNATAVARRLEIARCFDWSRQILRMSALIEDVLADRAAPVSMQPVRDAFSVNAARSAR